MFIIQTFILHLSTASTNSEVKNGTYEMFVTVVEQDPFAVKYFEPASRGTLNRFNETKFEVCKEYFVWRINEPSNTYWEKSYILLFELRHKRNIDIFYYAIFSSPFKLTMLLIPVH